MSGRGLITGRRLRWSLLHFQPPCASRRISLTWFPGFSDIGSCGFAPRCPRPRWAAAQLRRSGLSVAAWRPNSAWVSTERDPQRGDAAAAAERSSVKNPRPSRFRRNYNRATTNKISHKKLESEFIHLQVQKKDSLCIKKWNENRLNPRQITEFIRFNNNKKNTKSKTENKCFFKSVEIFKMRISIIYIFLEDDSINYIDKKILTCITNEDQI